MAKDRPKPIDRKTEWNPKAGPKSGSRRKNKGSQLRKPNELDILAEVQNDRAEDRQARRRDFQVNQSYLASMNPLVTGLTGLPRLVADAIIEHFPDSVATGGKSQTTVAVETAKSELSPRELKLARQVSIGVTAARKALSEAYEVAKLPSGSKELVSV